MEPTRRWVPPHPTDILEHGPDVPPNFVVCWTLFTQTAGAYGLGNEPLGAHRVALLLSRN